MSGETKRAERTGTNEQRDKAGGIGGTAERMDKRADGRADRWTSGQSRQSRTNKQRDEADRLQTPRTAIRKIRKTPD